MLVLGDEDDARVGSDDVSILAETSVRTKNSLWKLCQRISTSTEARFYSLLAQLIEKEQTHMDPWHSRILTQYTFNPPSSTRPIQEMRHRQPTTSIELPPLPPLDFSPSKHRKRPRSMSFASYERWTQDFPSIRPGMSVRVVRAERTESIAQYVIQVVDLHTKVMWVVRKRFRELYAFRKEIKAMCKSSPYGDQLKYLFDHLPFPSRSVHAVTSDIILRRRLVLETFLRNVASLSPDTQLHVAIVGKLQMELCSAEFITRLSTIDTSDDTNELKWLAFDLFRNINSCCTIEGDTCQRFLHVFRNRCAIVQACVVSTTVDHRALAKKALQDLRDVTTQIQHYVLDTLEPQYRRAIATAMCDGHTMEEIDEAIEECVYGTVEDAVMVPLQEQIQYLVELTIDARLEAQLTHRMEHELYGKSQSFFGIPDDLQSESNFGKACYHLSMMEERVLPYEKLKELVLSANEIFSACGDKTFAYIGHANSAMNADDFLPIHIYAVVHSGLKRPYFAKEFLSAMIHPSKMLGETGYFLTMFEAALKYVSESMS
ncbi:hypothetical protein Ae201684P_021905 [Aphanomyces euteiches]|uniref:VPS9 domain-containing protein n=1 Tax=Aphanomyces euteiches TaxID=100861 RepID=A0A6G0WT82_9STRA|nr:hypothetical protein Ae201684_012054 [Aphanomyces euteiches]KAH9056168.1 hypothetical protein Ae201684P_021905 [Aphanomyces euteiches]KAH9133127.1 hypothetical protein AeRB84_020739 [Aphanomyces euteiches]